MFPDSIYFSPNIVYANICANRKKKRLNIIHTIINMFEKVCLVVLIFSSSFFECSSENTGNKNHIIGQMHKKGILIILR